MSKLRATKRHLALAAALFLGMGGCEPQNDERPVVGPLVFLAVPPDALPASCRLHWKVRPLALATSPLEERAYFADVAEFWTGPEHPLPLDGVDAGLSNVYSTRQSENALVVFSVRFTAPEAAAETAVHLRQRYDGDSRYWVHQSGRILSIVSHEEQVPRACVEAVRHEGTQRASGAA